MPEPNSFNLMATNTYPRGDTDANWLADDPVIMDREMVLVSTNPAAPDVYDMYKVGNGVAKFSQLPYNGLPCLQELGTSLLAPISQKASSDYLPIYNISKFHTNNIEGDPNYGTNRFTLTQAINIIPEYLRAVGLKITFLNESGSWKNYQSIGGDFISPSGWRLLSSTGDGIHVGVISNSVSGGINLNLTPPDGVSASVKPGTYFISHAAIPEFDGFTILEETNIELEGVAGGLGVLIYDYGLSKIRLLSYSNINYNSDSQSYVIIAIFSIYTGTLYYTSSRIIVNGDVIEPFGNSSSVDFVKSSLINKNQLGWHIYGNIDINVEGNYATIFKGQHFLLLGGRSTFDAKDFAEDIVIRSSVTYPVGFNYLWYNSKLSKYEVKNYSEMSSGATDDMYLLAIWNLATKRFWHISQNITFNGISYEPQDFYWAIEDVAATTNKIYGNLFSEGITSIGYIDPGSGNIVLSGGKLTDFIPCAAGQTIGIITGWEHRYKAFYAVYDENKVMLSHGVAIPQFSKNGNFSIPEGAKYTRITVQTVAPGEEWLPETVVITNNGVVNYERVDVVDELFGRYSVNYEGCCAQNLYSNENLFEGYVSTMGTGNLIPDINGIVTDYIYVKGQKEIFGKINRAEGYGLYGVFYDAARSIISGNNIMFAQNTNHGSVVIPDNAVWFRQGVKAINETAFDEDNCYLGFIPLAENNVPKYKKQYGSQVLPAYMPGRYPFIPKEDDEVVNLYYFKNNTTARKPTLHGMNFVSMGDSITSPLDSWASYVTRNFDMKWTNLGVPGCHWVNYTGATTRTKVDFSSDPIHNELSNIYAMNVIQNQVYRLLQMITPITQVVPEISMETEFYSAYSYPVNGIGLFSPTEIDLVIISGGTNDCANEKTIGSLSGVDTVAYTSLSRESMWSAMKWAITVIRKYCPNARVVLLTPIQTSDPAYRTRLIQYVNSEVEAGAAFSTPVINMYSGVGIMADIEREQLRYLDDGLHPNTAGKKLMGEYVSSQLLKLYTY